MSTLEQDFARLRLTVAAQTHLLSVMLHERIDGEETARKAAHSLREVTLWKSISDEDRLFMVNRILAMGQLPALESLDRGSAA